MDTFETIVAAHNSKSKALADAQAMQVPPDEFSAGECIVWVRTRDRMLSIRYRGVHEIIAPEQFATDLRDILNNLFPVKAEAVKRPDGEPNQNAPTDANEWPKIWLTPSRGAIRFRTDKSAPTLYVDLSLNGHVTPSSVEFGNSAPASLCHTLLRPEVHQ